MRSLFMLETMFQISIGKCLYMRRMLMIMLSSFFINGKFSFLLNSFYKIPS